MEIYFNLEDTLNFDYDKFEKYVTLLQQDVQEICKKYPLYQD